MGELISRRGGGVLVALVCALALVAFPSMASAVPGGPPAPADPVGPPFVEVGGTVSYSFDDTTGGAVDHHLCAFTSLVGEPEEETSQIDPCTSPLIFSDLEEGQHTLLIFAVDEDGDLSDPAGASFMVFDGVPPTGSGFSFNGPADGSAQNTPMTGFHGTMDRSLIGSGPLFFWWNYKQTYTVDIDRVYPGGGTSDQAGFSEYFSALCFGCTNVAWSDSTPPIIAIWRVNKSGSLPAAEGQYRIVAGQEGSNLSGKPDIVDTRIFTIDTTNPQTTAVSTPTPGNNTSPVFTFTGNDPHPAGGYASGISHYECSLNGGAWQVCVSGDPLPEVAPEGINNLQVRAVDRAGNKDDSPAATSFLVDLTPPDITITRPANKDRYLLHEGPAPVFNCVDPLVGVPPATPGASGVASCTATPINDEDLGPHFFEVRATDHAGNSSGKKVVYTIDPPDYGKFLKQSHPLAYYRINETLGSSDMLDSSGKGHHGIYQNGIALRRDGATACERRPHPPRSCELANPEENKAAYFPARDGHGYVNGITAPKNAYTMEAWVKPRDGADMMVMSHGGGGQLFIKNGRLAFRQVQDSIFSNGIVTPGAWTHVAATWNGSVTRLFVNGSQVASSNSANKAPSGTATFYVGYGEMAPWFHGEIDEAAYYGSAISSHLIRDRWKVGTARDLPSLERGNSPFNSEGPFTDPQAPKNGGLYAPTKTPAADFDCSDVDDLPGDSDIASCTATIDGAPIANGAPLPDSLGTHTFTVTAVDKGGNQYLHHRTYAVKTFKDLLNADSPILYSRLGDPASGSMADSSGNGRHGTYRNAQHSGPVGISGDGDRARNFFGESGYGYVNNVAAPRFQATIEAWVNPKDGRNQSIAGHGDAGEIYIKDGHFRFRRMGETVTSSVPVQIGHWQQVVGTWDGADIRIYVNGVETGKAESTRRPSSVSTFYVGFGELAPWFYGAIDEVAYYPVALNANRVYQHWLADPPPDELSGPTEPGSTGPGSDDPVNSGPDTPASDDPQNPGGNPNGNPDKGDNTVQPSQAEGDGPMSARINRVSANRKRVRVWITCGTGQDCLLGLAGKLRLGKKSFRLRTRILMSENRSKAVTFKLNRKQKRAAKKAKFVNVKVTLKSADGSVLARG